MSRSNFARVYVLAAAAAVSLACGSNRTAVNEKGGPAERTAGETGRAVDDAAVTTKVKAKLAAESRLSTLTDISVATNNGVVTIAGVVPTDAYRKDVEQVARSVDGVTDVKNDIKVDASARRDKTTDRDRGDTPR